MFPIENPPLARHQVLAANSTASQSQVGGPAAAENPLRAVREPPQQPLELQYHLRLLRPTTHLLEIEIDAAKIQEASLDFVMPAWSPGRYAIYDFAKNVQEFDATGAQGQALVWTKLDKQTWHVETWDSAHNPVSSVRVRYRVFANDLNGTFSQFDASHANLNGASVYMYVAGHKQDPILLTVDLPPTKAESTRQSPERTSTEGSRQQAESSNTGTGSSAWKIISGFSESTEQRTFQVTNYDLLIDTPMEISDQCSLDEFRELGKAFRVAVHNFTEQTIDVSSLEDGLKKIVRAEMVMMPEPDFKVYTFLFHFAPEVALGDGMEHLNSTQIVIRGEPSGDGISQAVEIAAHEFFHLWNVKRLRPAGLGPFDYTRENYAKSLWFAEGITSYYAYVHLLRAGLRSRQEFLNHLAKEIRNLEAEPGRALVSAESSSFHAWFYDRSPQMQETNFANSTISYYNKGALLGMLLDLEIRYRTLGQKSLDDVLRTMYRQFYEAPATSTYGPGRGYEENGILQAISSVSGSDLTAFFDRYVRGTAPLPYSQVLAYAGLQLHVAVGPYAAPSLGVLTQPDSRGVKITVVRPGGPAEHAGLSRDDLVIAVDELEVATTPLNDRLKMYPPGAEVPFTIERHGRRERVAVTLDPPVADQYSIEELAGATPDQVNVRDGWLRTVTSDRRN